MNQHNIGVRGQTEKRGKPTTRMGRPPIERPRDFSVVYAEVRQHKITNRTAMELLGLKRNAYYNFVRQERERSE